MKVGDITNSVLKISDKSEAVRDRKNVGEGRQSPQSPGISSIGEQSRDSVSLKIRDLVKEARAEVEKYPEIREDRVRELQEKIRAGIYQVSNRDLAKAMIRSLLNEIS